MLNLFNQVKLTSRAGCVCALIDLLLSALVALRLGYIDNRASTALGCSHIGGHDRPSTCIHRFGLAQSHSSKILRKRTAATAGSSMICGRNLLCGDS
jgi:hypothetical protein